VLGTRLFGPFLHYARSHVRFTGLLQSAPLSDVGARFLT